MIPRLVLVARKLSTVMTSLTVALLIIASAIGGKLEAQFLNPPAPKYVGLPGVNAPKTLEYVNDLDYHVPGGVTYNHECKSGCQTGGGSAEINVVAQKRARKLDWFEALRLGEPGGWVVAKVTNKSRDTIPEFGLAPDGVMYQWVGHVTDGATRVAFFRMDSTGRITWVAMDQYVKVCEDEKGKKKSRVKYKPPHTRECRVAEGQGSMSNAALETKVPAQTWISCKTGCCQVNPDR